MPEFNVDVDEEFRIEDAYAARELDREEAVRQLVAAGAEERQARATVRVWDDPGGDDLPPLRDDTP